MSTFFSTLLTRMWPPPGEADDDLEAGPDERDAFALRVKGILETLGESADYDPEGFALRRPNGAVSWLGNRFDEYLHAPEDERDGIVLHVVRGILDAGLPSPIPLDGAAARPHLRPRIRQRAHLSILGLKLEVDGRDRSGDSFVPVSTDLGVEVVFDTPRNIVSLPRDRLAAWGLTPREALRIAVDNLRASASEPFRPMGDGVWLAAAGDCYDSARLLLTDEIRALGLDGAPLALPANRDTLAITGTDNVGGLYRMLQVALSVLERPRMDTVQPVVLDGDVWRDWVPPPDHPMRDAFYELAMRNRGSWYAEVQELLERRHARDGVDVFVASYGWLRAGDGKLPSSHAVWPPVRGWLPEADLVSVVHPEEGRYIVVPRDKIVSLAGHLLCRVPEVHPPYDAFDGAPTAEVWNDLRAHAVREGELER